MPKKNFYSSMIFNLISDIRKIPNRDGIIRFMQEDNLLHSRFVFVCKVPSPLYQKEVAEVTIYYKLDSLFLNIKSHSGDIDLHKSFELKSSKSYKVLATLLCPILINQVCKDKATFEQIRDLGNYEVMEAKSSFWIDFCNTAKDNFN